MAGHHDFEREPYDPKWAPEKETQLNQFLAENPEIMQTYGVPTITCRTTRCGLAFLAHGLDATLGLDDVNLQLLSRFNASVSELFERPEFEQFDDGLFLTHRTKNGVTVMLWHLVVLPED